MPFFTSPATILPSALPYHRRPAQHLHPLSPTLLLDPSAPLPAKTPTQKPFLIIPPCDLSKTFFRSIKSLRIAVFGPLHITSGRLRARFGAENNDVLRIFSSPAALTRRGNHLGNSDGMKKLPRTLFSRCGVDSPTSFLLCEDLDVVSLADVLILRYGPAFFRIKGL